ncbi:esterase-like activity of phytase family protein [Kovacikia minuta CCNUW1]|uniref:esterase-like activity of phytase family protein n=1 Tax=Kovacikia minuta TaxID=2931930 RepID=UPI001CC99BF0|nr:esterase-like activity of phytase family protein [Kovacikia minuta]UBF29112.1 esterase-like activity of phytase family protein [Kovacikia minuta CCNUW1]
MPSIQSRSPLTSWLLALVLAVTTLLTSCDLPQVSAEDRLFLNLSLDFLDEYQLPKTRFEGTPVGGLSAIAYDRQRDRFYTLSDDRSEFASARFYTLKLTLDGSDSQKPQIQKAEIEGVTFLKDADGKPFTKGSVDPEGLVVSPLRSLFVSSEGVAPKGISPFVKEFNLETGQAQRSLPIPERYIPSPEGEPQTKGVQDNLGLEALTVTPGTFSTNEPFRIFTATESSLVEDKEDPKPDQGAKSRVLHYLVDADRAALLSEHEYILDPIPEGAVMTGLTDLLAIDQGGHFLSLERSFGLAGFQVKLFQLTMGGATDISRQPTLKGSQSGVQPIYKKLLLNLSDLGIPLDNLEGIALGPKLPDKSQSLLLISDDNFQPKQVTQLLLFRLKGIANSL